MAKTNRKEAHRRNKPALSWLDLDDQNYRISRLEAREEALIRRAADDALIAEVQAEMRDWIADTDRGRLPGWKLWWVAQERREYTVTAKFVRFVSVSRAKWRAS